MRVSVLAVVTLLALAPFAACGGSSSSEGDDGAAGAPGDPHCVTDAECPAELPKCTQAGDCVSENRCDTDADCRGDYKFCDTFHNCEPCRSDSDCPSETPVCVPGWEFGVYCAVCRGGDSSTCPDGTWCTSVLVTGGGGSCEASNCGAEPEGPACLACVNESAGLCLADGGECSPVLTTFHACYAAEIPGWMIHDCPTGVVPSIRGCTPQACFDEAEAMDACLLGCDAVQMVCGL
ncbi:MAG TPA: hypothetical protein VMS65_12820 [Polyangiaceae bacterium]|nr:hypothetical protein [Polyangiaceae bacterium]